MTAIEKFIREKFSDDLDNLHEDYVLDTVQLTLRQVIEIANSLQSEVVGSPSDAEILTEAQKQYEDYGISYPESLVRMAKWAIANTTPHPLANNHK